MSTNARYRQKLARSIQAGLANSGIAIAMPLLLAVVNELYEADAIYGDGRIDLKPHRCSG